MIPFLRALFVVENCQLSQHYTCMCGYSLLRDPQYNKGLAFTEKERDAHYLRGLLPPTVSTQQLQEKKLMNSIRQYEVPLQKYVSMMDLQARISTHYGHIEHHEISYSLVFLVHGAMIHVKLSTKYGSGGLSALNYFLIEERNERLFYKLLIDNVEELLPVVYTPTVGEACQKYGSIFRRPQGLYISLKEKGKILEVLKNWPERSIQVIVVTDGERILGLGDLGGQFEDFANHNAFELLAKYGTTHLVFNDYIQGTASVVLAGVVAALKLIGGSLAEHTFLFLGAGEAGTGIAELIALEMSKQAKTPIEESRKKIWFVDSKGLIVSSGKNSLQRLKKLWAHEHEPVNSLLEAVKVIKPTVLIGSSGVGRTFTKEVIEAMASNNDVKPYLTPVKPLIVALSNPASHSECTAEEAYQWSEGRAIFASGSPFDPIEYKGKVYASGQANNAYIFPGFGLGMVISGAIRVHDDMLLAASKQVSEENYKKGLIYPPFSNIRKISANIAANVAAKAYELGLATRRPRPQNLVKYAESCMYTHVYRNYR
ncbi:hypothetical protein Fmac_003848 [Flemingia macrophylla]|uniref:Malic enzyme n=1 Tax=Flemingia macrophylla TaxID=520843 RepID=A0ABD1N3F6_9FABA